MIREALSVSHFDRDLEKVKTRDLKMPGAGVFIPEGGSSRDRSSAWSKNSKSSVAGEA